jgi:hypothetical protein
VSFEEGDSTSVQQLGDTADTECVLQPLYVACHGAIVNIRVHDNKKRVFAVLALSGPPRDMPAVRSAYSNTVAVLKTCCWCSNITSQYLFEKLESCDSVQAQVAM